MARSSSPIFAGSVMVARCVALGVVNRPRSLGGYYCPSFRLRGLLHRAGVTTVRQQLAGFLSALAGIGKGDRGVLAQ